MADVLLAYAAPAPIHKGGRPSATSTKDILIHGLKGKESVCLKQGLSMMVARGDVVLCLLFLDLLLGVFPCGHQHAIMPWWNKISHSGILNSTVGSDIPRSELTFNGRKWWDFLLAYLASTPIHKGRQPLAAPTRHTLMDGCRACIDKEDIP